MAVPKSRHTKSKRGRRRSHLFLKSPSLSVCPQCGQPLLGHRVCPHCGFYRGKEKIDVLSGLEKKERKKREKEMKAQERLRSQKKKTLNPKKLSKS
jgi:large subunit ribosomal protein L32